MLPGIISQTIHGGAQVSLSYTASASSTADNTVYTFSAMAIGTADANRLVVAAVMARAAAARTLSSVTIGGISASVLTTATTSDGGNTTLVAICAAIVPTGTTADVVATFSGAMVRAGAGVWRLLGWQSITPFATATSTGVNPLVPSVNVGPGMAVISAMYKGGAAVTWTGLTEDFDLSVETNAMSGASATATAWQTPRSVSVTGATSGAAAAVAIQ